MTQERRINEDTFPKWLNESLIKTVLKLEDDPTTLVTSFEITWATEVGDNYASDMYRVTVQTERMGAVEKRSFIVKVELKTGQMAKILSVGNLFGREIKSLTCTAPAIHQLLEAVSPGKYQPFSPKCLYTHTTNTRVIIMEDLKKQDFRMAERFHGLDLSHCLLVMRNIARYHASSVVLYQKVPHEFRLFMRSIYCEELRENMNAYYGKNIKQLAIEVAQWPVYGVRFAEKLHNLAETVADQILELLTRDDNEFNVLCHADLWSNNMMFRYSDETGEVADVRFIDYQLSHWMSPAIELLYFLYMNPSIDVMDQHYFLLEEYYKTLGETFTELGSKHLHPSWEQLNIQLERRHMYAVIIVCSALCMILVDHNKPLDIEKVFTQDETFHISEQYKEALLKILPIFEQKGWL